MLDNSAVCTVSEEHSPEIQLSMEHNARLDNATQLRRSGIIVPSANCYGIKIVNQIGCCSTRGEEYTLNC